MALDKCCLRHFDWDGTPSGREGKLASHDAYITGTSNSAAVLMVHDGLGWKFSNNRLLADHYAREADVTVYLPDFFEGQPLDFELIKSGNWAALDMPSFLARNARDIREPEIFACARALRDEGYTSLAAAGHCYGGWACFRLAAQRTEDGKPLVDCVSIAHPSLLTKADIDGVRVPFQILAPQHDHVYTPELKAYTFKKLVEGNVPFEYRHFPGVHHGCMTKGDEAVEGEREAMQQGKDASVFWFKQWMK